MTDDAAAGVRTDVPHGARIWNYWLGGEHNFEADRAAADETARSFPQIVEIAAESRSFLARAVRFLAGDAAIGQFLDLGAGLPTSPSTHEVARSVRPDARVVYVDNDPLVLGQVESTDTAAYIEADYHDPDDVLARAAATLDLSRPVALLCMGVFGYLSDAGEASTLMDRLLDRLAPGSYLAVWDGTDTSEAVRAGAAAYRASGSSYYPRTVDEVNRWFTGLELVEPGVVTLDRWRPDADSSDRAAHVDAYGGVARKP